MKITIFWFFGWAIVMFINSTKIGSEKRYLKKIILEILGLTFTISFISNFYSFSLWFELILIPFMALLASISAFASFNQKYNLVEQITNYLLFIIGIIIFGVSLYKTIIYFDNFATINTLKEFLIPILLSFMFIPFAYVFSIYGRWEQRKILIKSRNNTK